MIGINQNVDYIPPINTIKDIQNLLVAGFTEWKRCGNVVTKEKGDLVIFSYTSKAQHDDNWNFFEQVSRGLIINKISGEIVARPMAKFFNWMERGRRTNAGVKLITEKLDGCFLGKEKVNLWDGKTIPIRQIVNNKMPVEVVGIDKQGNIVPSRVIGWFNHGTKENWIVIEANCDVSRYSGTGKYPNKIIVTPNHHIFINNKFLPALYAKKGDLLTTIDYIPSPEVIHLIESGLLGDGSICKAHNAYRYTDSHIQKEYADFLNKWYGNCGIKNRTVISGYGSLIYQASTRAYKSLKYLRRKWYPDGEKCIPSNLDWIDDFTVAKWYMDDGSRSHHYKQKDRAVFHTNSFSMDDVVRLSEKLKQMYGVETTVFNSKGWTIRINAGRDNSIKRFWHHISPHIIKCMEYKLPSQYRNIKYIDYPVGRELKARKSVTIKDIYELKDDDSHTYFCSGKSGFDIKTETGNYFLKGILVHNSLGICYRDNGYKISTRGAFESEQAIWATKFLNKNYSLDNIKNRFTLIFEIIYPENRGNGPIIDYGDREDLVLLAIRDRFTGIYEPFYPNVFEFAEKHGFNIPKTYDFAGVHSIIDSTHILPINEEGYVVEFQDGSRFKFKGDKYVMLHRLISKITFNNVLKLMANETLDELTKELPQEFFEEASVIIEDIEEQYYSILTDIQSAYKLSPKSSRKELAIWARKNYPEYLSMFFSILDKKDFSDNIYKIIKNNYKNMED